VTWRFGEGFGEGFRCSFGGFQHVRGSYCRWLMLSIRIAVVRCVKVVFQR
jgi:hypothetical protein